KRLDILLIRRNGSVGRGEIYTVSDYSRGSRMPPFREWDPQDDPNRRELNATELSWWGIEADITVNPLPGKFAVSIKPQDHLDLNLPVIVHIYEFCWVRINALSKSPSSMLSGRSLPRWKRVIWRSLDILHPESPLNKMHGDLYR